VDSGTRLHASVETLKDNGFNATKQEELPGTNPDRDGYRRRSGSFALTQELAQATPGLRLRDAQGTTHYDSEFGPATQADESASPSAELCSKAGSRSERTCA